MNKNNIINQRKSIYFEKIQHKICFIFTFLSCFNFLPGNALEKDYIADQDNQIAVSQDFCKNAREETGKLLITQVIAINDLSVIVKAPYFYNINEKILKNNEIISIYFLGFEKGTSTIKRLTDAKDNKKNLVIHYGKTNAAFVNKCRSKLSQYTIAAYNSINSGISNIFSSTIETTNKIQDQATPDRQSNVNKFTIFFVDEIKHVSNSADADWLYRDYYYQNNLLINSFMKKNQNPEKDYHFVLEELKYTDGQIVSFNIIPSIDTPVTLDRGVCLVVLITPTQDQKIFQARNAYICDYLFVSSSYDNIVRIYYDPDGSDVVNQNLNLDPQITSIAGVFKNADNLTNSIISKPVKPVDLDRLLFHSS
ncbi:MAG: hypothetical protein HAW62_00210 [Endozoicomonadaceae bacterium]|nr:hypothetical protein [Endozoicomonadaceae bacterium]